MIPHFLCNNTEGTQEISHKPTFRNNFRFQRIKEPNRISSKLHRILIITCFALKTTITLLAE